MNFAASSYLWLLLLVPALAVFAWWAWRAKQRLMTQFIQARLLPGLLVDVSKARQKLRLALLLTAVALLAVTLARPQWGYGWEEVKQRGLDIVVAIDTSRSMLANDVAPNRLERAKLEALALKQICRFDRLGLVAFAGSAFLQCPLSLDDDAFRQSLDALDVNIIPQGGTALADAIRTAMTAFKEKSDNHKILVLFTDGEDHEGAAVEAAQEAAKEGLRIFTIGVGTPAGELLSAVDERGQRSFLKDDQGQVIKSHLDEGLLQEIAKAGNGFYLALSGAKTMDTLYERGLKPLPKGEFEAKTVRRYHERFQWFLGFAIVLLLVEMLLPDTKKSSKFKVQSSTAATVATVLLLVAGSVTEAAQPPSPPRMIVQPKETEQDKAAMRERRLSEKQERENRKKIEDYERRLKKDPNDARVYFNKGTVESENGNYEQAEQDLKRALNTPDLDLQSRAYYNLGNTFFHRGTHDEDVSKKKQAWEQATNLYTSALRLNTNDADARYNLDLVGKKIAMLPQPPPQPQQSKSDDQKKKDDQQKQDQPQQQKQQDQQKKDEQKQQQQQQPKPDEAKQDEQQEQEQDPADASKSKEMTPQQARQLLDVQKAEEKPMIFAPPKTNRVERHFKNW